ncbi:MAG: polysaccharide deacetylase family protein [Opitutales bacterium]|nr:polysaccharide deacetylase family protein [Opitutales bacterium]
MKIRIAIIVAVALLGATAAIMYSKKPEPMRVAIIFDDGPTDYNSSKLLKVVKEKGVRITLGSVGSNVEKHPDVARAFLDAGCEMANHTWSHRHPAELSDEELEREIVFSTAKVGELTGVTPRIFWPPFIELDPRMDALFAKAGLTLMDYSRMVSTDDWREEVSADEIYRRATGDIKDGTIILMHEWRGDSIEKLPLIIDELRTRGFEFVTFGEMSDYYRSQK